MLREVIIFLYSVVYLELIPNMNYEFKFKHNDYYMIDEKYPTVVN
jgi:hypothetical protein